MLKLFLCVGLISVLALQSMVVGQENAISLAKRLPRDTSMIVSVPNSGSGLRSLIGGLRVSEQQIDELFDLYLHTDPSDGREVPLANRLAADGVEGPESELHTCGMAEFLLKTESIHFVMHESKSEFGDWTLLFELEKMDEPVSPELWETYAKLWMRLVARFSFQAGQPGRFEAIFNQEFSKQLWFWEDSVACVASDKWICVGSTKEICQSTLGLLVNVDSVPVPDALFHERVFKSWVASSIANSDVQVFVATAGARKFLEASLVPFGETWKTVGLDAMPWIGYWWEWGSSSEKFRLNCIRKQSATRPLSSMLEIWEAYRPIGSFPPLPDSATTLTAKHVDWEKWNEIASDVYDKERGPGGFKEFQSDPISGFRHGTLRPKLGHLEYQFYVKPPDSDQVTLVTIYDRAEEASEELIEAYLAKYYLEMQNIARDSGFRADYRRHTVAGKTAWWTERYEMDPVVEAFRLKAGLPLGQQDGESATGTIIFQSHVVSGKADAIQSVIDWDSQRDLVIFGTKDYVVSVKALAEQYDVTMIHAFDFERSSHVDLVIRSYFYRLSRAGVPIALIAEKTRDRAKRDPDFLNSLSRPERLGFFMQDFMEQLSSRKPERIQIQGLDELRTRATMVLSWQFGE